MRLVILLAGIASVSDEDDIMIITDQGQIVRTHVANIPVYSRSASGVIVMRLSEGQSVVNFTKLAREEEETESEETAEVVSAETSVAETTEVTEINE